MFYIAHTICNAHPIIVMKALRVMGVPLCVIALIFEEQRGMTMILEFEGWVSLVEKGVDEPLRGTGWCPFYLCLERACGPHGSTVVAVLACQ